MQHEQQERFTKAIGSTDISAIAGTSPFAGPWDTYRRLTRPREDKDNELMKMGRDMEPYIVNSVGTTLDPRWLEALGVTVDEPGRKIIIQEGVSRHLDFDEGLKTRSTSDGYVAVSSDPETPIISIEAKLVIYGDLSKWSGDLGDYDRWVEEGNPLESSIIPKYYDDQCQWHMMHDRTQTCIVPMLNAMSPRVRFFVIPRCDDRLDELTEMAKDFWSKYIVGNDVPRPDASAAMTAYLAEKDARSEAVKTATGEHEELALDYLKAKEESEKANKRLDELKNRLREAVHEAGGEAIKFAPESRVAGKITYKKNKTGRKALNVKVNTQ